MLFTKLYVGNFIFVSLSKRRCCFFFACSKHRPEVLEEKSQILITAGKHPVINSLMGDQDQYVPNDTHLQVRTSKKHFLFYLDPRPQMIPDFYFHPS